MQILAAKNVILAQLKTLVVLHKLWMFYVTLNSACLLVRRISIYHSSWDVQILELLKCFLNLSMFEKITSLPLESQGNSVLQSELHLFQLLHHRNNIFEVQTTMPKSFWYFKAIWIMSLNKKFTSNFSNRIAKATTLYYCEK